MRDKIVLSAQGAATAYPHATGLRSGKIHVTRASAAHILMKVGVTRADELLADRALTLAAGKSGRAAKTAGKKTGGALLEERDRLTKYVEARPVRKRVAKRAAKKVPPRTSLRPAVKKG